MMTMLCLWSWELHHLLLKTMKWYNWINQLSNTTIWWLDICCLLHRYQLHVSALMAIFRLIDWQQTCKQLYIGMRLVYGGGGLGVDGGMRSRVCWVGKVMWVYGYSTHTRSPTPIQPQPPSTIHKTHAKVQLLTSLLSIYQPEDGHNSRNM